MRTLKTMILAFLFCSLAATASAQQTVQTEHLPGATLEIQGRIGGGSAWVTSSDPAGIPAAESGQAGDMNFGATLSLREFRSGLGVTAGYTHAFTGVETHYGTHAFDLRISERATFFQHGRFSASLLVEAGAVYMTGGAHFECPHSWFWGTTDSTCMDRDVSVGGFGGIGAVGIQLRYSALIAGVEADYRHVVGTGALLQQDDLMVMARVGVAFDL